MRSTNDAEPKRRSFIEEARRAQIIEAAIDTIAEHGYPQTSLARIAKHAGISKGVISYHFAGKDELVDQVIEKIFGAIIAEVAPVVVEMPDARQALRARLRSTGEYMINHRRELIALSGIFNNALTPDGKPRYGFVTSEELYQGLEQLFEWGQREGIFRDFNRRAVAVSFQASLDAAFGYWVAYPDYDLNAHIDELCETWDRALAAH